MDRRELEGLFQRVRAAQVRASDLSQMARVLRSESAEGRLERGNTRHRIDSMAVTSSTDGHPAANGADGAAVPQPAPGM